MGEWNLNSMETALEFQYCSTGATSRQGFDIEVETSETMSALGFEISGIPQSIGLIPNDTKTIWSYSFAGTVSGEHTLTFIGSDLAGNQLRQMQGDTANLYYRTGNNTWHSDTTGNDTSNPLLGTDTRHTFNKPLHLSTNCSGQSTCSDNYEPNNNAQEAWFLPTIGKCLDEEFTETYKLYSTNNDEDWFGFATDYLGDLEVTLSSEISNLDIDLLNPSGSNIDSGVLINGNKVVSMHSSGQQCRLVFLRIKSSFGNGCKNYNLHFNWNSQVNCSNTIQRARNVTSTINGNTTYCVGETIQLTASGSSYVWYYDGVESGTGTTFTKPNASQGNHTVMLLDNNDPCFTEVVEIQVSAPPTANAGQDEYINSGGNIQLEGYGGSNVSWTPTTGLSNPNVWNPVASPTQTTTYTLTVTENGCSDTDQVTVYVDGSSGGTPPANDNCSNAETLTSHTYQSFTNGTVENATQSSLGANQCSGSNQTSQDDYDVFYKFTAVSTSHTITIKDLASNFDGVIEIRSNCGSGANLACYDPSGLQSPMSLTYDYFVENQTYYIRIFEYNYVSTPPSSDTFKICVTHEGNTNNPPANDNCYNAETLTSRTYENFTSGTVENATESVGANQCIGCACSSNDDFDVYYKFTAVENSHTVHLTNYANNFDGVIELRRSCSSGSSNYISCYDPSGIPSSIDRTWDGLTPGQTYYIRVFEYNYVNSPPSSDTFDICVTHTDTSGDIDLVSEIDSVSDSNPNAGDTINVTIKVTNQGDIDFRGQALIALYFSSDENYQSAWDDFLGGENVFSLDAGEIRYINKTITLDNNLYNRWYYIISNADHGNAVSESNENNNLDAYPIHIGEILAPDIEIRNITVTPNSNLAPGQEINVEFELENDGNDDCNGFENLIVFDRNNNGVYDAGDDIIGNRSFHGLDIGERYTRDWDCYLPIDIPQTGNYKILIVADSDNDINELDEDDNTDSENIYISTITPAGADLIANFLSVEIDDGNIPVSELALCMGVEYRFKFNTENIGNLETVSSSPGTGIRTYCYISKDETISGEDVFVGSDNASTHFYIGETNNGNAREELEGFEEGDYFLLLFADRNNIINETNESNVFSTPIHINNCNNELLPDLKIDIESYSPYSSELGDYITVNLLITNIGEIGVSDFDVELFLSENQIFDGDGGSAVFSDHQLADDGSETILEVLEPGQSIQLTMTAYIRSNSGLQGQIDHTGIYYLFATIDEERSINELSRDNNVDYVPIELTSVDCYYHQTNEVLIVPYNQPSAYLFYVASEEDCTYNVDGQEDWINFPNNITRSGQAPIFVNMNNNPYPYPRIGHINYGNEVFEFTQEARPCEFLADDIKMSITSSNIVPIECNGFGSIDISIQNGFPPYTYNWSNGEITEDLFEVTNSGNHTVIVTDYFGCTLEETFTIGFADNVDISNINSSTFSYNYHNRTGCEMGAVTINSTEVIDCRDYILRITDNNTGNIIEEELFTNTITQELSGRNYNACVLIQGFSSNEFEYCFDFIIEDETDLSTINENTFTIETVGVIGCEKGNFTINASESINCHDYKISVYQGLTNIINNETFTNSYYIENLSLSSYDIVITLEGFSTDEFEYHYIIVIEDETDLSSIGENTFNVNVTGALDCVNTGSFTLESINLVDCHTYHIEIKDSSNNVINSENFMNRFEVSELPIDNYSVCITVEGFESDEFEYCFDFEVRDETDISGVNEDTFYKQITNIIGCNNYGSTNITTPYTIDCHLYHLKVTNSDDDIITDSSFYSHFRVNDLSVGIYNYCITIDGISSNEFEYCFDVEIIDVTDVNHITNEDFKTKVYGNFEGGDGVFKIQSFDSVDCHNFNLSIVNDNGSIIYDHILNNIDVLIDDLVNGNYTVCITIENISTDVFEYCYNISIKENDAIVRAYLDCEDNSKKIRFNLSNYDNPNYVEIRSIFRYNYDLWNGYKEGVSIHNFDNYTDNEHIEFSAVIYDSEYGSSFIDYYRTTFEPIPEFYPEISINRLESTFNAGGAGGISPYRVSVQNNQGLYYEDFFDEFSDIEFNLIEGLNYITISDFVGCNNDDLFKKILIKSDEFLLFPNPTYDYLNIFIPISILNDNIQLDIIDMIGKKVLTHSFDLNSNFATIDVSILPTATYIINIYSDGGDSFWSHKFIKR